MKAYKILLSLIIVLIGSPLLAQKSPKKEAEGEIEGVSVKIVYHSPSARGRTIMGELVPYDKVWRTGANNATTFEIDGDISIEGETLEAGRYGLFTIPGEDSWTIVFNSNADQWGAFNYDESDDVLRVEVSPDETSDFVESFNISVEGNGFRLEWENTSVFVSVSN